MASRSAVMTPFGLAEVDWAAVAGAAAALAVLVAAGEVLRRAGWSSEATRRFVHAGTGLFVAVTPWLFEHPAALYLLAVTFVVANAVALRQRWLPGMHAITRRSLGTVTFPLALLPAAWACWSLDPDRVFVLQTAFLVLALADPAASLAGASRFAGQTLRVGGNRKTTLGTFAFGLTAFLVMLLALAYFERVGAVEAPLVALLGVALVVAITSSSVELLSSGGWDNFFVVMTVVVVLIAFHERPEARAGLMAAVAMGALFAVSAKRLRLLDASGAVAAGLLAASVLGLGGWAWAVPAFTFFILSSLLSRWRAGEKAPAVAISEKGDVRDAGQVYANGGAAWVVMLVYVVAPQPAFYAAFVGAFAAAAADTWATEIGTRFGASAHLLTTGERVPVGTSGAVSITGTLGAAAGAASVGLAAWPFAGALLPVGAAGTLVAAAALGGFLAAFVDSLLGATLQARYVDPMTGTETERAGSPRRANVLVRGWGWIDNDRVNWAGSAAGALVAATCFQLLVFGF